MLNKKLGETKIVCILVVILQCMVIIFWGTQKEGLFTDEVFSYEGAKKLGLGMQYWSYEEGFYSSYHTKAEFMERITVEKEDLLIYQPEELKEAFASRDLYYTILNLAHSFYPGHFTIWTGILLNLPFFIFLQFILYKTVYYILSDRVAAVTVMSIYGFSAGAISLVLYPRCYMMLTTFLLLAFYIYLLYMEQKTFWNRMIYLLLGLVVGFISYKLHQFGMTMFAMMLLSVIIYMLVSKKFESLKWMIAEYGILGVVGFPFVASLVRRYLSGGMSNLFQTHLKQMKKAEVKLLIHENADIIGKHLFWNVLCMIIVCTCILIMILYKKGAWRDNKKLWIVGIPFVVVLLHYNMLIMGGARGWRYTAQTYVFIIIFLLVPVLGLYRDNRKAIIGVAVCFTVITGLEYLNGNISELYIGQKTEEEFLEIQYGDCDGLMIIGDYAGENYHYKAAELWPDESKVLTVRLSEFEAGNVEIPEDDRLLVWLTIDYDYDEIIEQFIDKTAYERADRILTTDWLRIYECKRK